MSAVITVFALFGELIDSSLGMMYGTILSPLLIGMKYNPKMVIPAILLSQGLGGLIATIGHNRFRNCDFNGWTTDHKVAITMVIPGILAVVLAVYIGSIIPKTALNIYIGILVVIMGILCVRPVYYHFSWRKLIGIGILAGFNKALSGGGFGPVTSTGGILGGVGPKASVGQTTYAEVPICILAFVLWLFMGNAVQDWGFTASLCIGSTAGAIVGPYVTKKMNTKILRIFIGLLAIGCGAWVLYNVFTGGLASA